jgi:hypothetical protein
MKVITERKICWPEFDAVCLEGGCGYCNDGDFHSLVEIEKKVEGSDHLGKAYWWGYARQFCNADLKFEEDGKKVHEYEVEYTEQRTRTVRVALASSGALVQDITVATFRGPVRQATLAEWERAEDE